MQESAVRRMASVQVIRYAISDLSGLIDKQFELAGLEIKEGLANVFKGVRVLIVGLVGLFLMAIALMIAGVLAFSLLSARVAFFLLGKGYLGVKALEGRLQGRHAEELPIEGVISADGQESD